MTPLKLSEWKHWSVLLTAGKLIVFAGKHKMLHTISNEALFVYITLRLMLQKQCLGYDQNSM